TAVCICIPESTMRTSDITTSAATNGVSNTTPSAASLRQLGCSPSSPLRSCQARAIRALTKAISTAMSSATISVMISGEVSLASVALRTGASGIEIGNELALEPRDLVFQHELALLQPLQLQLIGVDVHRQARDDVIEVAMLDAQLAQLLHIAKQLAIDVV